MKMDTEETIHYIPVEDRSFMRDHEIFVLCSLEEGHFLCDQKPNDGDVGMSKNEIDGLFLWDEGSGWKIVTSDPKIKKSYSSFVREATKRTRDKFFNNQNQILMNELQEKISKEIVDEVRALRQQMNTWINHGYGRMMSSSYTTLSLRSIQLSRMWLGKLLGAIGEKYPYPESSNPQSTIVEKATDTEYMNPEHFFKDITTTLAMTKQLRNLIGLTEKAIEEIYEKITMLEDSQNAIYAISDAETRLAEARMWLGMELELIDNQRKWIESGSSEGATPGPMPLY